MNYTIAKSIQIKKKPVVVLPLEVWQEIEDRLEEAEVLRSKAFLKEIGRAHRQYKAGKFIEYAKLRKQLKFA